MPFTFLLAARVCKLRIATKNLAKWHVRANQVKGFTYDRQINFCNIDEAKTEIKKFIAFYNQQQPHRSVPWLSPNQAYKCTG